MTPLASKAPLKARPTRERILRAGLRLFQAQGYHGTGVAEILALARAPKGSFYHHFPGGKDELAINALRWLQDEVSSFLDEVAGSGGGSTQMVQGLARYSAKGVQHAQMMHGSLMAVLAQEAAPSSPPIHAAVQAYAAAIRSRLAAACERQGRSGDAQAFAEQALAIIHGASLLARIDGDPLVLERIVASWLAEWEVS
ncbi:MAG: TetR/AcrR family transcriptional regulator [Phenylobacterium sp.]|uniref:TetR/AcrR family transcriptional regulator n=1 Tax=Phenylobacterium sp. TaxID=1871053 RepID=UPI002735ED0A|nr:TetR/AcrR family transcriptional regulator [Phenylobacterium sp.]MDP3749611.1 TetR/AcrR family transcriptional regulator [Phenylobacterium sp.]